MAPGSVAARPSPAARASQSPQASVSAAVSGSPDGRDAANFGPNQAAFSSGWLLQVAAARRVHVAGVGQHVGGRFELGQVGGDAVPAEHQHRGEVGADQVERVVAGQGFRGLVQLLESLLPLGRGAQREFAAGTAAVRRGELAPAVQDAADPGLFGVHRQPGPAGLLVKPADQRRPRPVPGRRLPGAAGELVADTQEQQRHRGIGLQADHDGTHRFRVCHALIMRADVSPARSGDNGGKTRRIGRAARREAR